MITPELAQAIWREREREAEELVRLAGLGGSKRSPGARRTPLLSRLFGSRAVETVDPRPARSSL
jgi:hypothetical protein